MNTVFKIAAYIFLPCAVIFSSCKKETSCEGCATKSNKPPIAVAGPDQVISLPIDSVSLDGRSSSDPDGSISNYLWTKISGPVTSNIIKPSDSITKVKSLVAGSYLFELKVTDNGGLSAKDTMRVTVNDAASQCSLTMIPIGVLSMPRDHLAAAAAGTKILFAGGWSSANQDVTSRVDIYDTVSQTWSTAELTQARYDISVIAIGNKIFFAGGTDDWFFTSRIDIYDVSSNTWSTAELSKARGRMAVAAIGNKVFFAGGDCFDGADGGTMINSVSDVVDIYDMSTNAWTVSHLSERRGSLEFAGTSLNNKFYVAGGFFHQWGASSYISNKVDVYDDVSGSWSTTTLTNARADIGTAVADNKIFWVGGHGLSGSSDEVEILDINLQTRNFHYLSQARGRIQTAIKDNKIIFFTGDYGDKVDIYNILTQTWCWSQSPFPVNYSGLVVSGNSIYVGGGTIGSSTDANQVWKLGF
ncbi:MAG: hypothetical protein E6H07_03975 [Bacteroidetes bacterium]|nr:MAG: hypothetical protein E6H07_03975 [Bacteroidota bacterium]